jgi:hypothetical protein
MSPAPAWTSFCWTTKTTCANGVAFFQRIARKEGREVLGDADWTNAGTAPAMRNAEGFVQIQVAHIGSEITRVKESVPRIIAFFPFRP